MITIERVEQDQYCQACTRRDFGFTVQCYRIYTYSSESFRTNVTLCNECIGRLIGVLYGEFAYAFKALVYHDIAQLIDTTLEPMNVEYRELANNSLKVAMTGDPAATIELGHRLVYLDGGIKALADLFLVISRDALTEG